MNLDTSSMISITIPLFNEAPNIDPLVQEITEVMTRFGRPFELVLVNDGSTDGSEEILDALAEQDTRIRVLHLKRNYGQTAAMMAGFDHAQGDIVVPMDGDLQNDPNDIPRLVKTLNEGYDLCSGRRKDRKDPWLSRRLVSRVANFIISGVSGVKLRDYGCTLKAYRRDLAKNLRLYGEMHRFIPVFAGHEGAKITEIDVHHRPRLHGHSHYGIGRTIKVILDLIVIAFLHRFLGKPIHLFGGFGLLNFGVAFGAVALAFYFKFFGDKSFIETPLPLLAVMTFITGTMCILMGILAEMLVRVYYQTHQKDTYAIRKKDGRTH